MKCFYCGGSGTIGRCGFCNGAGDIIASDGSPQTCWQCGGCGDERCPDCDGYGTAPDGEWKP